MFFSCGTGSFTLKLGKRFGLVKPVFGFTLFGSDCSNCFSRDLTNEQLFSPAYGKMSVCLLVTLFSFFSYSLKMFPWYIQPFHLIHNF